VSCRAAAALRSVAGVAVVLTGALTDAAAAATVTLTPAAQRPGGTVALSATGFSRSAKATVRLGSATSRVDTDRQGRVSAVLPVAASAASGPRQVVVRTGRRRVTAQIRISRGAQPPATAVVAHSSGPRLLVEPTRAPAGAPVSVRGSGFPARTAVELRLAGARVGAVRTSQRGSFSRAARVPPVAPGVGRLAIAWEAGRVEIPFAVTTSGEGRVVVGAAGDIACLPRGAGFNDGRGTSTECRAGATARVLAAGAPAAVLPLGDTQYGDATLEGYAASYGPTWGRFDLIAHPAVGDEEYETAGASSYFAYFGSSAGARGAGYYSFDVGTWHLIALNSECRVVACEPGSAQATWLRADLAAHPNRCTLAYWHRPLFTSGVAAPARATEAFWQPLYAAGAEVVLGGHNHQYERFAAQTPDRDADPVRGIRQFVVGTGGNSLAPLGTDIRANSEARITGAFGVLLLTLRPDGYDWRFVDAAGTIRDAGSEPCH
jgi:acid phosphatase type 7